MSDKDGHLLTIGMAAYAGHDWLVATIQALRMYQDLTDCELVVVDNKGERNCKDWCEQWGGKARYILANEVEGTAYPRDRIFREAKGRFVLCMDAHVFLEAGVLSRLKYFLRENMESKDLYSWAMVYDNLTTTHAIFNQRWGAGMYGQWALDVDCIDKDAPPKEIWAMGLGVFCQAKQAWLDHGGFNKNFKGFGGEEVYLHEKVRQAGHKVFCLPFLRAWHFFRPHGQATPYRCDTLDKFRNYLIGWKELGMDPEPVVEHFKSQGLNPVAMAHVIREVRNLEAT